ncbi:hypothetical protein D3C87_2119870 [compost metagenome]
MLENLKKTEALNRKKIIDLKKNKSLTDMIMGMVKEEEILKKTTIHMVMVNIN